MVDAEYKIPYRNDIGGCLLKESAAVYKQSNFDEVTKDGTKLGYTDQGDGAAVIKRPLLNSYVMNGNYYPIVLCIRDCSEHLVVGGSKNCTYIAQVFTELVKHCDPKSAKRTDWDLFYVDDATNVHKAGRILEVRFPCTTCLYSGKHILALLFSKVAKIPLIRVRYMLLFSAISGVLLIELSFSTSAAPY